MKVLKYLSLLLLLSICSLSIYIATSKGDFSMEFSKDVPFAKQSVYPLIANYKNWTAWHPRLDDTSEKIIALDTLNKTKVSRFSIGKIKYKLEKLALNDSLKITFKNTKEVSEYIFITDSIKDATRITWKIKGKLNYINRLKALFLGGAKEIKSKYYKKGLNNIAYYLKNEIGDYHIENKAIVTFDETFYIQKKVASRIDGLGEKIFESISFLLNFVKENNLETNGSPFSIFNDFNLLTKKVEYLICLPIKNEIYTTEGSDIHSGKLNSFRGYSTVLTGDYSHTDKIWNQTNEQIAQNNLKTNFALKPIFIYKKSVLNIQQPSQWETQLIIPILD